MAKILYIAGYGRSGSTILDIVLSNHSDILGVGEVTFLLNDWGDPNRCCSCGESYAECEFWKDLFQGKAPSHHLTHTIRKLEKQSYVLRVIWGLINRKDRQIYQSYHDGLFDYIEDHGGEKIIIDSSKSARHALGRFMALIKLTRHNVYVLHLVRNGLAVLESQMVTGDNWALEGYRSMPKFSGLRIVLGWVKTNFLVSMLKTLLGSKRYVRIRYEDFIAEPIAVLRKLDDFLGIDTEELICKIDNNAEFQIKHMVGGNRVRLMKNIKLKREFKRNAGNELKLQYRIFFALVGGWLNRIYDYN